MLHARLKDVRSKLSVEGPMEMNLAVASANDVRWGVGEPLSTVKPL